MESLQKAAEQYSQSTKAGLYYTASGKSIHIHNAINVRIAELNMDLLPEGIYNDVWFDYVTPEEFREIFSGAYLEFFKTSNVYKKLCNTDELQGGIDDQTNEWFNSYLLPKLIEAGLKYNAIVLPREVFANLSMSEFKIGEGFTTKLFNSKDEALAWLKSM